MQWGLSYGVNNRSGIVPPDLVKLLLNEARRYGIGVLDTACQYGNSESVLGQNSLADFRVITKTPSFSNYHISEVDAHSLKVSFDQSLSLLRCKKIYGLMIHRVENLLNPGGVKLICAMKDLKYKGLVEKIGVSVYDSIQIDSLLKIFTPDLIQLPLSVLDQRLLTSGHLEILKNKEIEIHVRSVLLQGLLLMSMDKLPRFFDPIRSLLEHWHSTASEQGLTANQAALSFVKNIPFVDTVLVGIENIVQLHSCVEDFVLDVKFDGLGLGCTDPLFVNPSLWKLK